MDDGDGHRKGYPRKSYLVVYRGLSKNSDAPNDRKGYPEDMINCT